MAIRIVYTIYLSTIFCDTANKFLIRLTDDCVFELIIESPLTILTGDSATGKSLLFKGLVGILNNSLQEAVEGINVSDICICLNEREVGNIVGRHHKFIFIDKYDIYSAEAKKQINECMLKYQNNWVVASRNFEFPNIGIGMDGIKEVKREKNGDMIRLYTVDYKFV